MQYPGMLTRPENDDEAEATWCKAEAEVKNIFEAEVEANNYETKTEASCLLLLQDVY